MVNYEIHLNCSLPYCERVPTVKKMINNKKVVVVLPAYNAAKTLEITYNEIAYNYSEIAFIL